MDYFSKISERCNQLSHIGAAYMDKLPFIPTEDVVQKIWDWAWLQMDKDGDGNIVWNGKNELAEDIIDSGVPFSEAPSNGSLHYTLGWSVVAQEANIRSLFEFIEGRQPEWIKFQCLAELPEN